MKIAVSATGMDLDSELDPRFGRCKFFLVVDSETNEFKVIENGGANATGGAGIQAAQTVIDLEVGGVITGQVGPNAYRTLAAGGIEININASGSVKDALKQYKNGTLAQAQSPSHDGFHGGA